MEWAKVLYSSTKDSEVYALSIPVKLAELLVEQAIADTEFKLI
jgi:hypothetical protein